MDRFQGKVLPLHHHRLPHLLLAHMAGKDNRHILTTQVINTKLLTVNRHRRPHLLLTTTIMLTAHKVMLTLVSDPNNHISTILIHINHFLQHSKPLHCSRRHLARDSDNNLAARFAKSPLIRTRPIKLT